MANLQIRPLVRDPPVEGIPIDDNLATSLTWCGHAGYQMNLEESSSPGRYALFSRDEQEHAEGVTSSTPAS